MAASPMSLADRFWPKVDVQGLDECWPFTGSIRPNGYGQISTRRGEPPMKAHRVAFLLTHGSLTSGMDVAHLCDEWYAPGDLAYRRCCNPAHLVEQTRKENLAHAEAIGRLDRAYAGMRSHM